MAPPDMFSIGNALNHKLYIPHVAQLSHIMHTTREIYGLNTYIYIYTHTVGLLRHMHHDQKMDDKAILGDDDQSMFIHISIPITRTSK